MRDAVIVGAARTPVGRRSGGLSGMHPVDLSGLGARGLADRTGFDPADVDDVIWGCVSQVGEQSWNVGRNAVLAAGWPESVPGTTLDRQCGSSQQAVHFAAAAVISGQCDFVVAGGVESMSRVAMGSSAPAVPGTPFGNAVRERYAGVEGFADGRRCRPVQPGRRRRDDGRPLGLLAHAARRVRAGQPREGGARRRTRASSTPRSCRSTPRWRQGRRGHPAGHHTGQAGGAGNAVQGRRRGDRRIGVADLRRRGRARDHHVGVGRGARPDARWPAYTPPWSPRTIRSSC